MSKFRQFFSLSLRDRALFSEAALRLGIACLSVKLMPLRWVLRGLRVHGGNEPREELSPAQLELSRRIRWSIRVAARHMPWRAVCLQQSLTAKAMLSSRGIPAVLYFGVRKSADVTHSLQAHAWVCAGQVEVTPRQAQGDFTVTAMLG